MTSQLDQIREALPAIFYRPNVAATEDFIAEHGGLVGYSKSRGDRPFFESDAAIRVVTGGNRSAKSTKCALEGGSNCMGFRPWYSPSNDWHTRGLLQAHRKNKGRIIYCVSNVKAKWVDILNEYEKWWGRDIWKVTMRDDRNIPYELTWLPTNWKIHLYSWKMPSEDMESIECDLLIFDEPPPENIWISLTRAVVSTGGRVIVAATFLDKSSWFWDQVVIPAESGKLTDVEVFWHSMWDNSAENGGCASQSGASIRRYLQGIGDFWTRLAREHGVPIHLGGLVLGNWTRAGNVINPFELPRECSVYSGIDPGGAKPMAAAWVAVLYGRSPIEMHLFDETYDHRTKGDLHLFAEIFKRKEKGLDGVFHPYDSEFTLIDPVANQPLMGDKAGRTMRDVLYEDYDIVTTEADRRNKKARLLALNEKCRTGQFKIWSNCKRAMEEVTSWSWDDTSPKLTRGKDDVLDAVSYIESSDPCRQVMARDGEIEPGIWVPERFRSKDPMSLQWRKRYKAEYERRLAGQRTSR